MTTVILETQTSRVQAISEGGREFERYLATTTERQAPIGSPQNHQSATPHARGDWNVVTLGVTMVPTS